MMSAEIKIDYVSVNEYIDSFNENIKSLDGRIVGEVFGLQLYEGRNYLFFSMKDKDMDAVLRCFMWKRAYSLSGVDLEDGMEIVISGFPSVHKPNGGLSFQVQAVELVGEGALKKAYEKLKAQLTKEGLFEESRKRSLPLFPQHVGLITSKDGAAIGDFLTNLGKFGFKTTMINSRVEGQLATQELLDSVLSFKDKEIDVLVMIRGGGSLESFLPFNNEILVREISKFPVPVLVGVGHERDVSLLALAADKMVSTPTAAANILNDSWQRALDKVGLNEQRLFSQFRDIVQQEQSVVDTSFQVMKNHLQAIFDNFNRVEQSVFSSFVSIRSRIHELERNLIEYPNVLQQHMRTLILTTHRHLSMIFNPVIMRMGHTLKQVVQSLNPLQKLIDSHDSERQLKLGYSILHSKGSLVRSINQVKNNDMLTVKVSDGMIESEVKIISPKK